MSMTKAELYELRDLKRYRRRFQILISCEITSCIILAVILVAMLAR